MLKRRKGRQTSVHASRMLRMLRRTMLLCDRTIIIGENRSEDLIVERQYVARRYQLEFLLNKTVSNVDGLIV